MTRPVPDDMCAIPLDRLGYAPGVRLQVNSYARVVIYSVTAAFHILFRSGRR